MYTLRTTTLKLFTVGALVGVTAVFFSWQGHILRRLPIAQL
ncbi:hypothetical protein BN1050_00519 [Metalysinibacillus saudimassiliensis]|uniref:Uncharacterized protein n=1 Tax=Metalysinibacillus saudimassiliensis TaxID=1461583 RepID=A0A078M4F9_9BACL|nr:hypothetical protein BN1050_00519 [Metalysinibacillus saudimassiliensis]